MIGNKLRQNTIVFEEESKLEKSSLISWILDEYEEDS